MPTDLDELARCYAFTHFIEVYVVVNRLMRGLKISSPSSSVPPGTLPRSNVQWVELT